MTTKASRDRFTGPHLSNGDRVAVQLTDGTLVEGYWYGGQLHDEPRVPSPSAYTLDSVPALRNPLDLKLGNPWRIWPNRPPAPWRIRCDDDGQWLIEKRQTVGWETHRYCATGTEAFATFAAGGAR